MLRRVRKRALAILSRKRRRNVLQWLTVVELPSSTIRTSVGCPTHGASAPKQPSNSWPIVNAVACGHGGGGATTQAGPATAGLIVGAPSMTSLATQLITIITTMYGVSFGMERFGKFLIATNPKRANIGKNASLGKALLADAAKFRVDLARSIKAVTVATVDGGQYLPVYAMLNTTPPVNMVRKILSFRRIPHKRSCLSFSSEHTLSFATATNELTTPQLLWHEL